MAAGTITNPARFVVAAFAAVISIGTLLLMMPWSTTGPGGASLLDAAFTTTSAVCVTGLTVVDTATHWTRWGQLTIMLLIQVGGFGIMTMSSLFALLVSRRLGLRQRMIAQAETNAIDLGEVKRVLISVAAFTALFELSATAVLSWRFWQRDNLGAGDALYYGLFHAVSAFNNAGFALFSDNLVSFATDWWLIGTIGMTVIFGGIGFPVMLELRTLWRKPSRWSLHTKITIGTTLLLLTVGTVLILASEWANGDTIGQMAVHDKVLTSWFHSVSPRTAGFNSIDYGVVNPNTLLVTDALMLIGAGSASTAGGIKVTTFALLGFIVWAELRGDPDVNAFGRRIPTSTQRQALAIALLSIGAVMTATFALATLSQVGISAALFESLSAFGTVGLTTGITPNLPGASQVVLIVLMFLGRVGPTTLFAAFILREHTRAFRYAEERPIIG